MILTIFGDHDTKNEKYSLLQVLFSISLFIFPSLCILYLLHYLYLKTDLSFLSFFIYIFSTVLIIFAKKRLLKKDQYSAGIVLGIVFLLCSILKMVSRGVFSPLPTLLGMLSFSVLLITVSEKWALFSGFIFLLHIGLMILIGKNSFYFYQDSSPNIYFILEGYWLFLLLIFILYRGCLVTKKYREERKFYSNKYMYLAGMENRSHLMGEISKCLLHDLGNPLSIISGNIKLLENTKPSKKDIKDITNSLSGALDYLESILGESLSFMKDCKDEEFNPDIVIKNILKIVEGRRRINNIFIDLKLDMKSSLHGNRCLFARVFLNILINSLEELEIASKKNSVVTIQSRREKLFYLLSIKDTGRGISEKRLKEIQKGEFSSKNSKHLGLGLLFVTHTVKNHFSGTVEIVSKQNVYTKVLITIPL